jgi:hypothetical protein
MKAGLLNITNFICWKVAIELQGAKEHCIYLLPVVLVSVPPVEVPTGAPEPAALAVSEAPELPCVVPESTASPPLLLVELLQAENKAVLINKV